MKNPFFTIIIPTYNRVNFLKIAVESLLAQNFTDYQIIIIDDGSSDKTQALIKKYQDVRIKYYYQNNQGPAAARNLGIKKAKGQYICFLDSDDRFRHDKLAITYKYIEENPEHKVFHTEEIWYRKGKLLAQKKQHQKPSGYIFEKAIKICSISISTAVLKKDIFKYTGLFDPALPACEDYDFWLRVTSLYPVYLIPKFLTIKEGGHPDQQSKKFSGLDKFRIYALKKILEKGKLDQKKQKIVYAQLKEKCLIYIKGAEKRGKKQEVKIYERILKELNQYEH